MTSASTDFPVCAQYANGKIDGWAFGRFGGTLIDGDEVVMIQTTARLVFPADDEDGVRVAFGHSPVTVADICMAIEEAILDEIVPWNTSTDGDRPVGVLNGLSIKRGKVPKIQVDIED